MPETLQVYLDRKMPAVDTGINAGPHSSPRAEFAQRRQILQEITDKRKTQSNAQRMIAGAAGFFNFDMAVTGDYGAVALFDINMRQSLFWREMCKFIIASPTRKDFYARFAALKKHVGADEYPQLHRLASYMMGADNLLGDSIWASTDEGYQKIRTLAVDGRIGAVTLDITDVDRCKKFGEALRKFRNGAFKLDLVYGSNIWEFMSPQLEDDFMAPLRTIALKSMEVGRQHSGKPERKAAMRPHILAEFSPRFASPAPTEEQQDTLVEVVLQVLDKQQVLYRAPAESGGMPFARANQGFIDLLCRRFTMSDIETLGLGRPSQGGFYAKEGGPAPTLNGLRSIAGDGVTVYVCDTKDGRNVAKFEGGTQKGGRDGK